MIEDPQAPRPASELPARPVSLVDRAKNIITNPKAEWARIEAEPATVGSLFTSYAMILAAVGPVASLIGSALIGFPLGYAIGSAVFTYLVSLVVVFVTSLIIDALAPTFGGTRDPVRATKLAVYSATPGWLVGILGLIPQLMMLIGLLALVAGVYGIYILYLGLPRLMRVSEDRAIGYVAVVVVAWLVLSLLLMYLVMGTLMALFFTSPMMVPGATY